MDKVTLVIKQNKFCYVAEFPETEVRITGKTLKDLFDNIYYKVDWWELWKQP